MTTKKAVVIIGLILGGLVLLVALFVAGIAGFVFYTIGNTDAAETAKNFLRANERLRQEVGEVRDFGFFVTGSVKTRGAAGDAVLGLKAKGARKSVNTTVELVYRAGREWRVVEAYFVGESGERVYLTRNFEEDGAGGIGTGEGGVAGGGDGEGGAGGEGDKGGEGGGEGRGEGEGGEGRGVVASVFDEEAFAANVLESERPVLVVVGTPSSLDSLELDKTLDLIAPKYEELVGLVRYNLSEQPAVLQRLEVKGVPTVILYKNGAEQERRAGKITRQELTALINKHLE